MNKEKVEACNISNSFHPGHNLARNGNDQYALQYSGHKNCILDFLSGEKDRSKKTHSESCWRYIQPLLHQEQYAES